MQINYRDAAGELIVILLVIVDFWKQKPYNILNFFEI